MFEFNRLVVNPDTNSEEKRAVLSTAVYKSIRRKI